MSWSETRFKARIRERAAELGMPLYKFVDELGLPSNFFTYSRKTKIEMIEQIAKHLDWTMAEALDYRSPIDVDISRVAFDGADLLVSKLPRWARSRDIQILAHATIYDLLAARHDEGRLPTDSAELESVVRDYVDILVRAWRNQPQQASDAPTPGKWALTRLGHRRRTVAEEG